MGETTAHAHLKRLAVATLLRWGCQAAASEVLCPISRFRVDAAGYLDAESLGPRVNHLTGVLAFAGEGPTVGTMIGPRKSCEPRTVILECKQSREDFLRDRADLQRVLDARDRLEARRRAFLSRVMDLEPELQRRDGLLFGELGEWELDKARHPTYRRIVRELEAIEQRLHGGTKFCRLARYRLADRLYLLAPSGMVKEREVPPGWGLVECGAAWSRMKKLDLHGLSETDIEIRVEAPRHGALERRRVRLLRNIAIALTRASSRRGRGGPGTGPAGKSVTGAARAAAGLDVGLDTLF